jgi:hypothetical protein
VSCPLDCNYLIEARQFERYEEPQKPEDLPNMDVELTDEWFEDHQPVVYFTHIFVAETFNETREAVDSDFREALDSLCTTYRTARSGLIYESLPTNPIAANIHRSIQERFRDFRQKVSESGQVLREVDIFNSLVYMQRMALLMNNGRRRGRAFIHHVLGFVSDALKRLGGPDSGSEAPQTPNLIIP